MENKIEKIDIDWIASNIQQILNKVHSNSLKRQIKVKHDRLTFACPICGDSHKNASTKRGHLFFRDLNFKCFNENCFSTFTKLCTDYDITLDPDKKLGIINYVSENSIIYKKNEDNILANEFNRAITLEELKDWFDSGLGPLMHFKPIQIGSLAYKYLKNRGFHEYQMEGIYEGIKANSKWSEPFLVFLNLAGNKVLGFQERNLKSGDFRRFKIWTFSEIYRNINGYELDPIEAIPYNKISQLFNIFNVDYEKDITLFEAYLDSKFFPNSVGAVGLNTDMTSLVNNELKIRFFFDYDNPGKRKSKYWLKKGHTVFLWDKFIHNWILNQKTDYYSTLNWINLNIKDANDIFHKMNIVNYKVLLEYFSNDILDLRWITNDIKHKNKKENKQQESIHDIDWQYKINQLKL